MGAGQRKQNDTDTILIYIIITSTASGEAAWGGRAGGEATAADAEEGDSLPEQCAAWGKESLMTLGAQRTMTSISLRRVAIKGCLLDKLVLARGQVPLFLKQAKRATTRRGLTLCCRTAEA